MGRKSAPMSALRRSLERLEERWVPAGDMVLRWNTVMLDTAKIDHNIGAAADEFGPTRTSRAFAIVQSAVYDAANSITHAFQAYKFSVAAAPGASVEAAIAQAAHDTLVYVYPHYAATFDADLAQDLAAIPAAAAQAGAAVGASVATQVIASRTNDGSQINLPYTPTGLIGHWAPDPLHPSANIFDSRLGKRNAVRHDQRQPISSATSAGAGQPRVHGCLQRIDRIWRRRNHHCDGTDGRPNGIRHLLGLRRPTRLVQPAAARRPGRPPSAAAGAWRPREADGQGRGDVPDRLVALAEQAEDVTPVRIAERLERVAGGIGNHRATVTCWLPNGQHHGRCPCRSHSCDAACQRIRRSRQWRTSVWRP